MLGRKTYTQEELDAATTAINQQLAAYRKLVKTVDAASDPAAKAALEAFEPLFANNLVLSLDRRFVHRLRGVTGKDGTPLNELELLTESLMNNGGELRPINVIKYVPGESVLKLDVGARIELSAAEADRLAKGVLAEIRSKYVE
jgi:hypothetical protein